MIRFRDEKSEQEVQFYEGSTILFSVLGSCFIFAELCAS